MEFTFEDAGELCSLLARQEALVDRKRRWLASMIPAPDGCIKRVKRPKFLNVAYLSESYIRNEEESYEKVRASIEKSLSSEWNDYSRHLVQDGLLLFDFQKRGNEPFDPEYLSMMQCTISKLTYEALQSVVCFVSHKYSFDKTRPAMEKIVNLHLPSVLKNLDKKDTKHQLFNIFTNPCSYRPGSVSLVTPVSSHLLSAINHALDGLEQMPMQCLVAMNRKLQEKTHTPKFGLLARSSKREHVVKMVRKRCNKILTDLEEGDYLPKKLAKAMSVTSLYWKLKLRSVEIPQSEFFPFAKETVSLQNNIVNALWSLAKLTQDKLKLLRPILDRDSKVQRMHLKIALRNYLTECLFECDEAGLPDEALRAIAFIIRISGRQQVVFTEERNGNEVDAVLNLSSHLKALANRCTEECSCGEDLIKLDNDSCNKDSDFILCNTNYFNLRPEQQQMLEPCCSNSTPSTAVMGEYCWSETVGDTHDFSRAENSDSKSREVLRKSCERTGDSRGTGHYSDNETVGVEPYAEKSVDADRLKMSKCSETGVICDETSTVAHMLIGRIIDKLLLAENSAGDEHTQCHTGLDSQGPQDDNASRNMAGNLEGDGDVVIRAVKHLLPNLPESCLDRVKRLMS